MMLGRISDEVLYNFFFTKIFNFLVPKLLKLSHIIKYLNYKNSVSYTHLDVYKRQVITYRTLFSIKPSNNNKYDLLNHSYTR